MNSWRRNWIIDLNFFDLIYLFKNLLIDWLVIDFNYFELIYLFMNLLIDWLVYWLINLGWEKVENSDRRLSKQSCRSHQTTDRYFTINVFQTNAVYERGGGLKGLVKTIFYLGDFLWNVLLDKGILPWLSNYLNLTWTRLIMCYYGK